MKLADAFGTKSATHRFSGTGRKPITAPTLLYFRQLAVVALDDFARNPLVVLANRRWFREVH
jgi:hypothetical protein